MRYIDPHIHMVSRTTDDYARMAQAGCVAITEPAPFTTTVSSYSPRSYAPRSWPWPPAAKNPPRITRTG